MSTCSLLHLFSLNERVLAQQCINLPQPDTLQRKSALRVIDRTVRRPVDIVTAARVRLYANLR